MWVRHFKWRSRTKKYKAFLARYQEFRVEDCVELCGDCHKEIHRIYYQKIYTTFRRGGLVRMCKWSWGDANRLMARLRKACDRWVAKPLKSRP
jgi:hypothetical protein